MHRPRIIPILLLSGKSLVKTIRFSNPGYVGDPLNAVRIFNEKKVDELIVLDIGASNEGAGPNMEMIRRLAEECFMPLCYGGGITDTDQIRDIFLVGVEKVAINTALHKDLNFLRRASELFGSQSIVASIDCKKKWTGYATYSHSGAKVWEYDPVKAACAAESAGAGEILVNSVERDGLRQGFDHNLCRALAEAVSIPVIACGGGGTFEHFKNVINETGVAAAAGGSYFIYQGKHRAVLITYPSTEEIESIAM